MKNIGLVLALLTVISAVVMRKNSEQTGKPASMGQAALHAILGLAAVVLLYFG